MQTTIAQPTLDSAANKRQQNKNLIHSLTASKIYQDYERAVTEATGLPVSFRPVESWQ
jgi:hypothetical protein